MDSFEDEQKIDMEDMKMEVEGMFKKYGISKEDALKLIALIKTAY